MYRTYRLTYLKVNKSNHLYLNTFAEVDMTKPLLLLAMLLCISLQLYCVNHLDLMFMMQGQDYDQFGQGLASLDFNGDGYDDLAVLQNGWEPDSILVQDLQQRWGKLLVYYGGPGFDSTPEFTVEGTYPYHLGQDGDAGYIVNLGDVNGDGYDDLGVRGFTQGTTVTMRPYIAIYYGGRNPSHQPGYYKSFPSLHSSGQAEIDPAGDVNNDGYDDFFFTYRPNDVYEDEMGKSAIILGGTMTEIIWRQYTHHNVMNMSPIGDVNNDSFDDYISTYFINDTIIVSNTLFYGSASAAPTDSILLYAAPPSGPFVVRAKGLGDLNGDGIDDFTGLILYPNTNVWYGNMNLTPQFDLALNPSWSGNSNDDRGIIHGDLNNDGYDDVIGSMPIEYGENGGIRIWLGGANMNGISDFTQVGTYTNMLLGTGLAAGDFNGDGICDVAVSAPHNQTYWPTPGRIYVYSGNTQLADTTEGVDDNVTEPVLTNWDIKVIPNPFNGTQSWRLRFSGTGYKKYSNLSIRIYNLKGQKMRTLAISTAQLKSGEVNLPSLHLPAGIYEISVYKREVLLKTRKITIR